jgi:hypothetical protein
MNVVKSVTYSVAILALVCTAAAPRSQAQIAISIGEAPSCPYGYYEAAPYGCAPSGYYGPEWFTGGVFVGAGPWFHGSKDFHGQVDTNYNEKNYKGTYPARGEKAEPAKQMDSAHFKGNEDRDGRGHVTEKTEKH